MVTPSLIPKLRKEPREISSQPAFRRMGVGCAERFRLQLFLLRRFLLSMA